MSAPFADIRFAHACKAFQKLKHGRVAERLTANPASPDPRRDDDARHPESTADRKTTDELMRRALGRPRRWDMIGQTIVLIEARRAARTNRIRFLLDDRFGLVYLAIMTAALLLPVEMMTACSSPTTRYETVRENKATTECGPVS